MASFSVSWSRSIWWRIASGAWDWNREIYCIKMTPSRVCEQLVFHNNTRLLSFKSDTGHQEILKPAQNGRCLKNMTFSNWFTWKKSFVYPFDIVLYFVQFRPFMFFMWSRIMHMYLFIVNIGFWKENLMRLQYYHLLYLTVYVAQTSLIYFTFRYSHGDPATWF